MGVPALPRLLRRGLHRVLQLRALPQGGERRWLTSGGRMCWFGALCGEQPLACPLLAMPLACHARAPATLRTTHAGLAAGAQRSLARRLF